MTFSIFFSANFLAFLSLVGMKNFKETIFYFKEKFQKKKLFKKFKAISLNLKRSLITQQSTGKQGKEKLLLMNQYKQLF
jgi:hypothetical protein